jgi:hypothetical protein
MCGCQVKNIIIDIIKFESMMFVALMAIKFM